MSHKRAQCDGVLSTLLKHCVSFAQICNLETQLVSAEVNRQPSLLTKPRRRAKEATRSSSSQNRHRQVPAAVSQCEEGSGREARTAQQHMNVGARTGE